MPSHIGTLSEIIKILISFIVAAIFFIGYFISTFGLYNYFREKYNEEDDKNQKKKNLK